MASNTALDKAPTHTKPATGHPAAGSAVSAPDWERIDGAWYWVCGCEMCLQSGKSCSYIVCEEHDRCATCRCTRDQLTEAPWGAKGGGWRCKPCDDTMKAEARAKALAAATAQAQCKP